ncbi:hypothetical protein NBC122_00630 [Chryseobacterium salivictor]|uniref:Uncharacterized protein n=1 Tax=Chryseobacterium salivictor TaxID=2547600 RepID=A0A4P6ZD56_9FLAO|nr:hypothetical protein NBC122_00630 [Chryseobacterium salivictor]
MLRKQNLSNIYDKIIINILKKHRVVVFLSLGHNNDKFIIIPEGFSYNVNHIFNLVMLNIINIFVA